MHRLKGVLTLVAALALVSAIAARAQEHPKEHPKEQLNVFVDGKVICLDDYKSLTAAGRTGRAARTRLPEKGQKEELESFLEAIEQGGEWPIALWEQAQATRIALEVEDVIRGQR